MPKPQTSDHLSRRYQAGEHEAVWAEMVALGAAVREPAHFKDAQAVATETMRRARHNFELLIRRLDTLQYRFEIPKPPSRQFLPPIEERIADMRGAQQTRLSPEGLDRLEVMMRSQEAKRRAFVPPPIDERIAKMRREQDAKLSPAGLDQLEAMMRRQDAERRAKAARQAEEDAKQRAITDHLTDKTVFSAIETRFVKRITGMEKKGLFLPLSLRAWIEQVGHVCLIGSHPQLCFFEGEGFPGIYADPFMMLPDPYELQGWLEEAREAKEIPRLQAVVGWTAEAKARLGLANEQLDYGYEITLPNPAADAPLKGERHGATFVEYLRIVFRWGGFPGWERQEKRPDEQLKFLTDGLLPI
ncbi:MAG: hypothetical protein ACXWKP_22405 [Bradyrhizobium sp.]